jgi:hypothetical protein
VEAGLQRCISGHATGREAASSGPSRSHPITSSPHPLSSSPARPCHLRAGPCHHRAGPCHHLAAAFRGRRAGACRRLAGPFRHPADRRAWACRLHVAVLAESWRSPRHCECESDPGRPEPVPEARTMPGARACGTKRGRRDALRTVGATRLPTGGSRRRSGRGARTQRRAAARLATCSLSRSKDATFAVCRDSGEEQ